MHTYDLRANNGRERALRAYDLWACEQFFVQKTLKVIKVQLTTN